MKFFKKIKVIFTIIIFLNICAANAKDYTFENGLRVFGCCQMDGVRWSGYKYDDFVSGADISNVTVNIQALNRNFTDYFLSFNYNENSFNIDKAYIGLYVKEWRFRLGKFGPSYGAEHRTDIENRSFLQPYMIILEGRNPGFFGIEFLYKKDVYSISAGLYIEKHRNQFRKIEKRPTVLDIRGFIYTEVEDAIQHFGAGYKVLKRDPRIYSYLSDIPSYKTPTAVLYTQFMPMETVRELSLEFIEIWNSLYLQAEVSRIYVDHDGEMGIYTSAYFQSSWIITGEHHYYDFENGVIINPYEAKYFFGIIELLIKYGMINLTADKPILRALSTQDGLKKTIVAGINWHVKENVKIQISYACDSYNVRGQPTRNTSGIGIKVQFTF